MPPPTKPSRPQESLALRARILATISVPPQADLYFKGLLPTDFYEISDKLLRSREENGWPLRLEYYSPETLLVIRAMPSPVHECVQDWFQQVLADMQRDQFVSRGDWLTRISRNATMDFKDFRDSYRGSWKQPDYAIRSMRRSLPNLVIEVAFSQSDELLQRKVQLWLEGSRGVVQVVIVVKMREGPIRPESGGVDDDEIADESSSKRSSSDCASLSSLSDDGSSSISLDDTLVLKDDLLVGPIDLAVELWRWKNDAVRLDSVLVRFLKIHFPAVCAQGTNESPLAGEPDTLRFPLKITDLYGSSPGSLPLGRSADEVYHVDAGLLVDYLRLFRPLLGRHRRIDRAYRKRQLLEAAEEEWVEN